jgi:hypothetical protein
MIHRSAPNSLWRITGWCTCDGCNGTFGLWDLIFTGRCVFCRECAEKREIPVGSLPVHREMNYE